MATDEVSKPQSFSYLDNYELGAEDTPTVLVEQEFVSIEFARPGTVTIDGVSSIPDKFCIKGAPSQNMDHFYLIPLYINSAARQMYIESFGGESQAPDCDSLDGLQPRKPLMYNNQAITQCSQCPLFGYGREFKCKNKGVLIALAYFPHANDLLIPVRKFVPGTSMSQFKDMARALTMPVKFGEEWKRLPEWSRIVRVSKDPNPKKQGHIQWAFSLLSPDSPKQDDMPHCFVPEHLIAEIQKFVTPARQWVNDQRLLPSAPAPALTGGTGAPALTGGTNTAPAPASTVPPDPTVVKAEEASDY